MSKANRTKKTLVVAQLLSAAMIANGFAISVSMCLPPSAIAQNAPTGSFESHSPDVHLDLSSTEQSLQSCNTNIVNIQVGGSIENGTITGAITQAINPGQMLTPSQYVAVSQVLSGGQTLLVNDLGQAIGGSTSIL